MYTRVAVRSDLASVDDDPRLIFTGHQTTHRQCCVLPDVNYSRWRFWPDDKSYLRHNMDCWWMVIDSRGHPPSIPVMVHRRAAQHQIQDAGTEHGCRSIAMVVVAVMMAMAFAGKGRAHQSADKGGRERVRAPGPDERLQQWPSALFVPHCCSRVVDAAPATHRHREKQIRVKHTQTHPNHLEPRGPDPCTCPLLVHTERINDHRCCSARKFDPPESWDLKGLAGRSASNLRAK